MKRAFPFYTFLAAVVLVVSEILHLGKVEPFYSWFYSFAWWSYILVIDGIIFYLKGNSLLMNRTREFFLMIPWSIFTWLIFEAANFSLRNWYYINLPPSTVERWLGYAVAYGTVLPGIFETTELLETIGWLGKTRTKPFKTSSSFHTLSILLGTLCLMSSVLLPYYCFPLIWIGFIFLLEPINYRLGGASLLRDLEQGNPRRIYLLLIAGLICGLLWEFWNFWARSKWVYTVPFFEKAKGFEMPFLGFLGFPPFAVQVYVMYNTLSLFRFQRGWEESTCRLHPERQTRRMTKVLSAILIISFSILVFRTIDLKTVDSYDPSLSDAFWIPPEYRTQLPKVGIADLEELVEKARDRKERDELALRLMVPKEDVYQWVRKAELVQVKGLGVKNLRVLESVGVDSVPALSAEDPDPLQQRMKQAYPAQDIPSLAKIRIWVKEAKKRSTSGALSY